MLSGSPLDVEKKENPSKEDIDALHERYIDALLNHFNKYCSEYASDPKKKLVIV
ncbi:unnamed protein product [Darwinula stevensoni]|uniref:Uncharacterized protein n=1 Tax=Darwinula stevensoni TaxID=69355 RepID=A0A7R9AJE6_9CRUS|nr:unnamed protein product [Darwinula stevensoni]CAG0906835.1 unnamed protein product [Darwinula stevensoni]